MTDVMTFAEDDPRLVFMPLDTIQSHRGACNAVHHSWWVVHPEKGLIFYTQTPKRGLNEAAPQCNRDRSITGRVIAPRYPWADIRQIPLVLHP